MREFSVTIKEKIRQIDYVVLFCVLGMNILSLLTLFGASNEFGTRFLIVQSAMSIAGLILMFAISYFDYDKVIKFLGIWTLVIAVVLMLAVIFFGTGIRGNRNWLYIPGTSFGIQPSEFVKLFFIITFAQHIKLVQGNINHIKNVIALGAHAMFYFALILATGDLGSGLVFLGITIVMLLVGGLSMWYFIGAVAVIIVLSPFLWEFLSETQQNRIIFGFDPEGDPLGKGFQALSSRRTIAAGGFLGAGLFGGKQFPYLSDAYSDFLFAVLAEKFGFFGCFAYIALMGTLIIRILWIARIARKDYGAYMCAGVVAVMMCQSLENIGMCLAMLPVVGITLPFFSYGGSSVLASYLMIGLVQSIKSHNQKYFFEREKS